jgi:hypothetical protein
MNVNVLVLNVFQDFRPTEVGNRGREHGEQFAGSSSNSGSPAADQVIDLKPQDGVWVGKEGAKTSQTATHSFTREAKALHTSPTPTTYNHDGKVHHSTQDKGLRINITA